MKLHKFLLITILSIFILSFSTQFGQAEVKIIENQNKIYKSNQIINTTLIINDQSIIVNSTFEVTGNLTIINSILDFSPLQEIFDSKAIEIENGGYVFIKDSILKNGFQGIDGETSGTLILENVTISGFIDDNIDLKNNYRITITDSVLNGGRNGIQIETSIFTSNITNTVLNQQTKDAVNTDFANLNLANVQVLNSADDGFQIEGNSIINITNSIINGAGGDSIKFRNNRLGSVFIKNVTISNGAEDALQFSDTNNITVINSTFVKNGENGFQASQSTDITMINSKFLSNGINTGNGIEISNATTVYLDTIVSSNNKQIGINFVNIEKITIENSIFQSNDIEGGNIIGVNNLTINSSKFINNTVNPIGANGLNLDLVNSFEILFSSFESNSGNGIFVENSIGKLEKNSVKFNGLNGIVAGNTSEILILNNSIQKNGVNGIDFSFTANGRVNFNTISDNSGFGLFVQSNRSQEDLIDANNNFWGSDIGPFSREYSGPINITFTLNSKGQVQLFTPPFELNLNIELIILTALAIILLLAFASFVYYRIQMRKWRIITKPVILLLTSKDGLPIVKHEFLKEDQDEVVISGFISAINSFSSSIVSENRKKNEDYSIQEIRHEAFTMLVRPFGDFLMILVVNNSNSFVRARMDKFVTEVKNSIPEDQNSLSRGILTDNYEKLFHNAIPHHFNDFSSD